MGYSEGRRDCPIIRQVLYEYALECADVTPAFAYVTTDFACLRVPLPRHVFGFPCLATENAYPIDVKKAPKGLKTQILTSYLRFIIHTVHNDP